MIEPVELKIPSSDGRSILHVMHWRPVGQPRAVLQIAHGMTEHVGRYGEFAAALAEQGIAVIGHDHLGHGKTAGCEEKLGFFAEKNGAIFLVQDIHRVHVRAVKLYPEIPKFILGHSMGSFLVRRYLTKYGWEEDGAILMGTGDYPAGVLLLALAAVNGTALVGGDRCRSRLLHHLVLGNYNRRIPGAKTPDDWLSRDEEKVNQFVEDPLCQFRFTCSAYRDFFRVMLDLKKKRWVKKMPASLPLFLVSGDEDPVGNYGKGVRKLFEEYHRMGMEDVEMKLYDGARHEILNELGRETVYMDLASWILRHSSR